MTNLPTTSLSLGQAARLDVLDGVVNQMGVSVPLLARRGLVGFEAHTVENIVEVIIRARRSR